MADGNSDYTTSHNLPLPQPKTTRRRFLIGGAAGVGLLVGYLAWPRNPALVMMTRKDETVINAWLKVGADGRVVVLVPQAEMGQGVYTALPQIVAEELGAAWESISVEPVPVHPIYANTLVMQEGTEALPGFLQGIARWTMAELSERLALQVTGGSTSVRAFYETLRIAGATAREMLCRAAGRRWGVDWTECRTENSAVVHEQHRATFAELAADAAKEEAPESPELKKPVNFSLIGRSVPRIDVPSKIDGTARFGADVRLPGMVYAAVKAGPVVDAPLISVDETALQDAKGWVKLIRKETWAAVAAENWWQAQTLLEKARPEFDLSAMAGIGSATLDGQIETALADGDAYVYAEDGDVDDELAEGAVVEREYRVPYLAHACLEPMTATARISGGRVEIWAPTQSITWTGMAVARALDMPKSLVTVYPTLLGGGFGRKLEADAAVQAALIAREVGRPVQLIWSREEDLRQDKYRPAAIARLRAKVDQDGRITAWHNRIASQSVQESFMGRVLPLVARAEPDTTSVQGAVKLPYRLGAYRVEHVAVESQVPVGFWRSVGHSYNAFFVESFMDELARAAKKDPLAFRLNALKDSPRHAAVLERAAQLAGWGTPLPRGQGRGIAVHETFGSVVAQVAHVAVDLEGKLKVLRVACVVDCGMAVHPDLVKGQMEGGILFGLSAALHGEVTFDDGFTEQSNFDTYPLLTMAEAPRIDVQIINSSTEKLGGVGEAGVPPIAPAVANAIAAATGVRIRRLPIADQPLWPEETLKALQEQAKQQGKQQAAGAKAADEKKPGEAKAEDKKPADQKPDGKKTADKKPAAQEKRR